MITKESIEYIKSERALGTTDMAIKQSLLNGGWNMADVQEAFNVLNQNPRPVGSPTGTPAGTISPIQHMTIQPAPTSKKGGIATIVVLLVLLGAGGYAYWAGLLPFSKVAVKDIPQDIIPARQTPQASQAQQQSSQQPQTQPLAQAPVAGAATATPTVASTSASISTSTSPLPDLWSVVDAYYGTSTKLRSSDYGSRSQDDKQAIFNAGFIKVNTATSSSYTRNTLILVNDKGTWKLLKNFTHVWTVAKGTKTSDQIEKELQLASFDADKDGLSEIEESCGGIRASDKSCAKTDPNKRDTDGDGLWDGTEAFLI